MTDTKAEKAEAIDPKLVRKLADILNDTGLTDIEVERGDLKIKVSRNVSFAAASAPVMNYAPAPAAAPSAPASSAAGPAEPPAAKPANNGQSVTSPMVGTVYLSPSPGSDPFVRIGAKVSEGQTLLIIEAMKTMNPIAAPRAGTVVELLVADAQPVEFGEALVVIE
ncbi:MAG: acetyl-CoA carboxylase biotin carboxyl carrier protein [Caulobacteraceae bacterium]|nr:acetyl-CoA carboxylase biotin carboxyl carrier protein [Caulobacteraceae bacterium]